MAFALSTTITCVTYPPCTSISSFTWNYIHHHRVSNCEPSRTFKQDFNEHWNIAVHSNLKSTGKSLEGISIQETLILKSDTLQGYSSGTSSHKQQNFMSSKELQSVRNSHFIFTETRVWRTINFQLMQTLNWWKISEEVSKWWHCNPRENWTRHLLRQEYEGLATTSHNRCWFTLDL